MGQPTTWLWNRREWRGGQSVAVKQIALWAVGPAVANLNWFRNCGAGRNDSRAFDFGGSGREDAVGSGNLEAGQLAALG